MRIVDSSLALSSRHEATRVTQRSERLETWVDAGEGQEPASPGGVGPSASPAVVRAGRVGLADELPQTIAGLRRQALRTGHLHVAAPVHAEAPAPEGELQPIEGKTERLYRALIFALTGEEAERIDLSGFTGRAAEVASAAGASAAQRSREAAPAREGWGLRYDLEETTVETESTQVSVRGEVTTADGRSIQLAIDHSMQRVHAESLHVSVRAGDARLVDPLVLTKGAGSVAFTGARTAIDLDADGRAEDVAQLATSSAYLALDRNGNGRVDDGRELFGPSSGDGFAELAALDDDGNGWIDEGDRAFAALRLWRPGEGTAPGELTSLSAAGVGAIGLDRIASPLTIDSGDEAVAELRSTGVYLQEDGAAGTIQHVDLLARRPR